MNEQEIKDNFTQLWQRVVAIENVAQIENRMVNEEQARGIEHHKRLTILEEARKVQIQVNTDVQRMLKADPDKPSTTREWWRRLL